VALKNSYKKIENGFYARLESFFARIGKAVASFFRSVVTMGKQRFTIMLIPHSEKKVFNIQVTLFALVFVCLLIGILTASFFWYSTSYAGTSRLLTQKDDNLKSAQASLDVMRDETTDLLKSAKSFESALSSTLDVLGIQHAPDTAENSKGGDLSSFFNAKEISQGNLKEVSELKQITDYLNRSIDPVKEIGALLNSQNAVLSDIPTLWPVRGGIGHISMYFGQNKNPFTGLWYLHKGVDISTFHIGDPVIATADGTVVTVDYEAGGFGNYIIIKHKHGFYTRYAHLQYFRVSKGQKVQQGQIIGAIGNTGLTTGPHLHYEVHLGSDVVDPIKFLNIRHSLASNVTGGGTDR
jgi:murein DD-endopeptidase MepM/ murein hydrolase activator NlpD